MKLERAELRAAVQATEAAAEDTGGKVMDASFAEFLGILNGVDRISKTTAMNIPAVAGGIESSPRRRLLSPSGFTGARTRGWKK